MATLTGMVDLLRDWTPEAGATLGRLCEAIARIRRADVLDEPMFRHALGELLFFSCSFFLNFFFFLVCLLVCLFLLKIIFNGSHLGRKVHTIYIPEYDGHPTILTNEHSNMAYTRSTIYMYIHCTIYIQKAFTGIQHYTFCTI